MATSKYQERIDAGLGIKRVRIREIDAAVEILMAEQKELIDFCNETERILRDDKVRCIEPEVSAVGMTQTPAAKPKRKYTRKATVESTPERGSAKWRCRDCRLEFARPGIAKDGSLCCPHLDDCGSLQIEEIK